jgi:hypothetical protein
MLTATLVFGAKHTGICVEACWICSKWDGSKPVVAITMPARFSRQCFSAEMHPAGLEKSITLSNASGHCGPMGNPIGLMPE